ncbi:MAG: TatD family hydrolase [Gammaproteobacteria bacterium]|jgi:TatD DNase family protein
MPLSLVDSHCHLDRLDLEKLGGDLDDVLDTARRHGVTHMLCVSIDMENVQAVMALAQRYAQVFASVGVHPNEQDTRDPEARELVRLAEAAKVVAIGETGLDYHYGKGDLEWQRERFRRHIRAARESHKPLIIHSRDAREDTIRIMRDEGAREVGGVMHCFTEDWTMAERAMELDFYISFSGIVTFRNADALREVARRVPLERMLVETDAPYLTPVPYRGKSNQPAYVRHVAEHIAELRDESLESIARTTTDNFFKLFRDAAAVP